MISGVVPSGGSSRWDGILIAVLIAANLLVAGYFFLGHRGDDFHGTHGLTAGDASRPSSGPSADTSVRSAEDRSGTEAGLPSPYRRLSSTGLFDPGGERLRSDSPPDPAGGGIGSTAERFRLVGRIRSHPGGARAVLQRREDGRVFVVQEGGTVGRKPLRLESVGATTAVLEAPDRSVRVLPLTRAEFR